MGDTTDTQLRMLINGINPIITANNCNVFTMQLAQFPCTTATIKEKYSSHSCMAGPTSVNKHSHQKPTDQKDLVFNCLATFKHKVPVDEN